MPDTDTAPTDATAAVTADVAPAAATPAAVPAPVTAPTVAPVATAPAADIKDAGSARAPKIDGDFDPERAARLIERLRAESAEEKTKARNAEAKAADTLKAVAKALGLADDDKPDPAALAAQLEQARSDERQRRAELQILRIAPGLEADADALLDSQAFSKAITGLDPEAGTFRDAIEDAIRDFLSKSPRYRLPAPVAPEPVAPTVPAKPDKPAGKSGTDMSGQSGKPRQITVSELETMTPEQIVDAQTKGLLDDLLGR